MFVKPSQGAGGTLELTGGSLPRVFQVKARTSQSHHAALSHAGLVCADSRHFGYASQERSSTVVLLLHPPVGRVPGRDEGVLEVQATAIPTDLPQQRVNTPKALQSVSIQQLHTGEGCKVEFTPLP